MKLPEKINEFVYSIGSVNRYSLLDRLRLDCDYYLGYGNRSNKCLWGNNVKDHIRYMKYLYLLFPINAKPEWISMNDILSYEKEMNKLT